MACLRIKTNPILNPLPSASCCIPAWIELNPSEKIYIKFPPSLQHQTIWALLASIQNLDNSYKLQFMPNLATRYNWGPETRYIRVFRPCGSTHTEKVPSINLPGSQHWGSRQNVPFGKFSFLHNFALYIIKLWLLISIFRPIEKKRKLLQVTMSQHNHLK